MEQEWSGCAVGVDGTGDDQVMGVATDYGEFVRDKVNFNRSFGFAVSDDDVSGILKPHQRDIVRWAVEGGRRAIFAQFGLGKSLMALEIMRLIGQREGGRQLIVCPLGVRQEFIRDAREHLGWDDLHFVRHSEEVGDDGLYLTNYESIRDGKLSPDLFNAVSLDEASVLRSYGSKTFHTFLPLFEGCKYRFVATATPSPNRYKELIHYAGFLGIMDTGEALTRWFQRDSTKANQLTLYPHKEHEFWLWLNTWAIFLQKPSDLGYSDEGYELPPMEVVWHKVATDASLAGNERDGQFRMFHHGQLGVSEASREKRVTMDARIAKAKEIVDASPDDHFVLWHDLEDERRAISKAIPDAVEVYGALDLDIREDRIADFSDGKFRILSTKPVLSGSGCNFQRHCHRLVFVGVGFKFNDFIQSCHRVHRFLQTEPVRIDIIYAESEHQVVEILRKKWAQHEELTANMSEIIREHGLNQASIDEALRKSIGVERVEASGAGWTAVNNDCVLETRLMKEDSVDLVVTSIPFSNHYEYTPAVEDFGSTDNNDHFWRQMDFLTPELFRILQPGRRYCCHVKDRVLFGNVTGVGMPTISPFHAEAIVHGMKHGFLYQGMITIVTDVVRENNQTYRLGWSENCKDGTKMGVGSPEYVLLFRKPQTDLTRAYADVPVTKSKEDYSRSRWQTDAHSYWRSSGDRHITPEDIEGMTPSEIGRLFRAWTDSNIYDYEAHVTIGEHLDGKGRLPSTFMQFSPTSHHPDVWTDIVHMRNLNGEQARRDVQLHICPLPFDIVDRLIERYSNPGDLVFDPFGGLMTVPVRALALGRRGYGVELNAGYWADGVHYCRAEEIRAGTPSLFDLLEVTQ